MVVIHTLQFQLKIMKTWFEVNFAELKRYIEQQKAIIVYYEEAVKPKQEEKE